MRVDSWYQRTGTPFMITHSSSQVAWSSSNTYTDVCLAWERTSSRGSSTPATSPRRTVEDGLLLVVLLRVSCLQSKHYLGLNQHPKILGNRGNTFFTPFSRPNVSFLGAIEEIPVLPKSHYILTYAVFHQHFCRENSRSYIVEWI